MDPAGPLFLNVFIAIFFDNSPRHRSFLEGRPYASSMVQKSNRKFHDRIAGQYDRIYDSPYWRFYREISWDHLKKFLPETRPATAGDLGCGTGWFGLRLAKSGFHLIFLDPSGGMLARARENLEALNRPIEARYIQAGLEDMGEIEDQSLSFATAQGDPLSFCKNPRRALLELRRILKPGATCVLSVDHRVAGLKALSQGKTPGPFLDLLKTGRTEWKAHRSEEGFPMKMFDAHELQALAKKTGFETLSLIGKTCLVQRSNETWLEDPLQRKRLIRAEEEVHGLPPYFGLASHLQIALRRT